MDRMSTTSQSTPYRRRGRDRDVHERAVGHDREFASPSHDVGLAERDRVMPFGHFAFRVRTPANAGLLRIAVERAVVDTLRLEEHDRVV